MQAIVHITAYGLAEWTQRRSLIQQQIQMSIGALKKLSEIWEMASIVMRQVKGVAKAVLDPPGNVRCPDERRDTNPTQHSLEGAGIEDTLSINPGDFAQEDIASWFDDFLAKH